MFVVSGSGVWTPASAARSQVQGCAHRRRSETLGTGVTADMNICGVAARALLLVACARHLQQTLAQVGPIAGVDTSHPECAWTRSKRTVLHSFTLQ